MIINDIQYKILNFKRVTKNITQFCTRIEPRFILSIFESSVESQLFGKVTLGGSTGENHVMCIKPMVKR